MTAPFGIALHEPMSNLEIQSDLGGSKFVVTAPRPHPSFESYIVQATTSLGVVWVKGVSPTFEADSFGLKVRVSFDEIQEQLNRRYGASGRVPGSGVTRRV